MQVAGIKVKKTTPAQKQGYANTVANNILEHEPLYIAYKIKVT